MTNPRELIAAARQHAPDLADALEHAPARESALITAMADAAHREAKLREALEYIMDGYGLDAPAYKQPFDELGDQEPDDWIVTTIRAALTEQEPI